MKERFSKGEMRMEKVSARDSGVILGCSRAVMICLTSTEVVEILRLR